MLVGVCFVAGFKDMKSWVVLFAEVIVAFLNVGLSLFVGVCGGEL